MNDRTRPGPPSAAAGKPIHASTCPLMSIWRTIARSRLQCRRDRSPWEWRPMPLLPARQPIAAWTRLKTCGCGIAEPSPRPAGLHSLCPLGRHAHHPGAADGHRLEPMSREVIHLEPRGFRAGVVSSRPALRRPCRASSRPSRLPTGLCLFVFDTEILSLLPSRCDRRVEFIRESLLELDGALDALCRHAGGSGSGLIVRHGCARDVVAATAFELGVDAVPVQSRLRACGRSIAMRMWPSGCGPGRSISGRSGPGRLREG